MRIGRLLGVSSLLVLAGLCNAAMAAEKKKERIPAIVLPLEFVAFKGSNPLPEVTAAAKEKLEHSYQLAYARNGAFDPMPPPPMSEQESAVLAEHLGFLKAHVIAYAHYRDAVSRKWMKDISPGYSIGPGLSFLAERSGAEVLVYAYGWKYVLGAAQPPRALLGTAYDGSEFLVLKNTQIAIAVVELRTGKIRWMNLTQDINADVTDRRGANAYMLPAFGDYPKSALGDVGTPKEVPPAQKYEDYSAKFTVMTPVGWQRERLQQEELVLNRHGKYIDSITVDLDRKPVSSDPIEIGHAAIRQLKAVGYEKLEIDRIEPATVAGLPGFVADLHFSGYFADDARLPFRRRLYGVANKVGVYLLTLNAASTVYFDEDLPAFETMVGSLKLGEIKVYPAGKKPKD
jgi:hypothetical protein